MKRGSVREPDEILSDVAVVTGAGRGIGRAIARRLAADGAVVAVLDADGAGAEETTKLIHASGGSAMAVVADVSDRGSVGDAVEIVEAELGPITILVNNAGVAPTAPFLTLTDAEWESTIAVNVRGPFLLGQAVAWKMLRRGRGKIINVSSVSARTAHGDQTAYAVSKAGVEALTRAMAFELGPIGINVNAVAPGPIMTDLNRAILTEDERQSRVDRLPVGRMGEPEDVAAAVAYLAGPDSAFVVGTVLAVDGGFSVAGVRGKKHVALTPELTGSSA